MNITKHQGKAYTSHMTRTEYELLLRLVSFYKGNPGMIQHTIKVYTFSKMIAEGECVDEKTKETIALSAIVHDVGIKVAEEKYGRCDGKLQEKEGQEVAEKLLSDLTDEDTIRRVSFLVAHHHTYSEVDGIDWRILLEADYLVNAYEGRHSKEAMKEAYEHIFETKTGKNIFSQMFTLQLSLP